MRHMPILLCAAFAALTIGPAAAARADDTSKTPAQADTAHRDHSTYHGSALTGQRSVSPAEFVQQATIGGMTEVELGRAAASRASSPEVKAFAAKMVEDHARANAELAALAGNRGLTVPTALDARRRARVDQLLALSGEAFDREYLAFNVSAHAEMMSLLDAGARLGDAALAAFARKTMPVVQAHHAMAERDRATLAGGTDAD